MLKMQSELSIISQETPAGQARTCSMKSKIRELRKLRKLSQEELAEAVGTTRQTITSIEVGRYTASLPLAYKIAHYFGLPIEAVFDFSDLEQEVRHGNV